MTDKKPHKIVFAPGCLEQLEQEMSHEELQQLMNDMQAALENGTLFSDSNEVDLDELEQSDPELYKSLTERLEAMENTTPPTLN
jgi:type II secretory pathway component PulF